MFCAFIQVPSYGALGIIAANCLNLALRIAFSLHFITARVPTPIGKCGLICLVYALFTSAITATVVGFLKILQPRHFVDCMLNTD